MIRALIDREIVDKWVIRIWVRLAGKISQGLQNDEIQFSERIVQPTTAPSHYPSPAQRLIAFIHGEERESRQHIALPNHSGVFHQRRC